ncbi:FAD-binding protein [Rhodobacteraceae bacterium NNCM2]|nr:FAD-binding protein [Coraliihabitans acroporae]
MSIDSAIAALAPHFGDRLSTADGVRDTYGRNEAWYPVTPPDAVVWPETTEEVSLVARTCTEHGCPIVAWGAGTSLEGHIVAVQGGITLCFDRMNKVLEVHEADMDAVVQPGVTRKQLNEELRATGLFFPIDPGADASIGGMAATRASGTCAVRYGTMRESVMALEVVLADGRIIRTGSRARKASNGYDLTKLFVGSEGTLGIITELTVRLHGQPEAISAAICSFDTIEGAIDTVIQTIQMSVPVARIELLDAVSIRALNAYSDFDMAESPTLFIEFHGTEQGVAEQAETLGELCTENGGHGFEWATRTEDRTRLWSARHNFYYAIKASCPGRTGYNTDACVPISRLADCILESLKDVEESGFTAPLVGHVGDGNFHLSYMVEPGNAEEIDRAKALADRLSSRTIAMGGTVSGEHGIGIGKRKFMAEEHGADAWALMGDIKRTLDPAGILNPGKVVPGN